MPIFAMPIGRTRRDQPFDWASLLLIGPIESDRRRILMEPGGRDGKDLKGVEGVSTKNAVEIGGQQGTEDVPQPVIMDRGARQARLKEGKHPPFLPTCPHFIEGMMAIQNRQE